VKIILEKEILPFSKGGKILENKIIKFDISNAELIQENQNSSFSILSLDFFADGENAHDLFISEATLEKTAPTIKNCPIVWKYNPMLDDATTHSAGELAVGVIPQQSEITRKKMPDGRTMLTVAAIVWKRFSGRILDIFKRDGSKPISVEIRVNESRKLDTGITELLDYCFEAVTVLGTGILPAIPKARATVLQFSKEYQEDFQREFSTYSDIDFTISPEIKSNVEKGLKLHKEFKSNADSVKLAASRHLAKNEKASPEKVRHIAKMHKSFDTKNMVKNPPNSQYIVYLMMGGKEGAEWSKEISDKLDQADANKPAFFAELERENMQEENFVAKENVGKGDALKVNKSKEALSEKSWGEVDKASLVKKCFDASNWKSVIPDVYMLLEDGWEDGKEDACKYPVMCIEGEELVYNRYGLSSALAYAEKENETAVVSKVKAIYEKMGLDKPEGDGGKEKKNMAVDDKEKEKQEEEQEIKDNPQEEQKENPKEEQKEEKAEDKQEEKKENMSLDGNLDVAAWLQIMLDETEDYQQLVDESKKEPAEINYAKFASSMYTKMCKMSEDYKQMSAQHEDMCGKFAKAEEEKANFAKENEELKKFKADIEKQQFNYSVDSILKDIETKVEIPTEELGAMRERSLQFSMATLTAWENEVKAKSFDFAVKKVKGKEGDVKRMALPFTKNESKTNSGLLW
jgi:hypothetical protein